MESRDTEEDGQEQPREALCLPALFVQGACPALLPENPCMAAVRWPGAVGRSAKPEGMYVDGQLWHHTAHNNVAGSFSS